MGLAASKQEEFWEACGFGNLHRAQQLLEEGGVDINWVSYANDCCPIHVASQGKPDIVKMLVESKCNVNVRDNRHNLPLHHAAMKGHVDIVQVLIDAGSEINAQEKNGWTALHKAAYWCHLDVVKVLLKNGSNVNIKNNDERTALQECARSQEKDDVKLGEIAHLLIKAGSDIEGKSSDWGEADLTGLMYASFHNHPDVASAMIQAGCDLNAVGTTFWSALHWAADRGNDEIVYLLLEAGIDPTLRDMKGDTALERAKSEEIRETLKVAIDLQREVQRANTVPILQARPAPPVEFKPACDVNFKSQSYLPKNWKPSGSMDIKNLINEKKSKLAAMTSQKYREDLARRTGTKVITDQSIKKEASGNIDCLNNETRDNASDRNTANELSENNIENISDENINSASSKKSEDALNENTNKIKDEQSKSLGEDISQSEEDKQIDQVDDDAVEPTISGHSDDNKHDETKNEDSADLKEDIPVDDHNDDDVAVHKRQTVSGAGEDCGNDFNKETDNNGTAKEDSLCAIINIEARTCPVSEKIDVSNEVEQTKNAEVDNTET